MRKIRLSKGFDLRARRSETPIKDALLKAVYEFSKAGVVPSDIRQLVIAPDVFDRLRDETNLECQYPPNCPILQWLDFAGLRIEKGV